MTVHIPADAEIWLFKMGGADMPFKKPPLSMNDRMHWAEEVRIKRDLRHQVFMLCKTHKIAKGAKHVRVELIYRPATRGVHDPDNLAKTTKTIADALTPRKEAYRDRNGKLHPAVIGYGLIPDDPARYVSRPEAEIVPSEGRARQAWWVRLTIVR